MENSREPTSIKIRPSLSPNMGALESQKKRINLEIPGSQRDTMDGSITTPVFKASREF